MNKATPQTIERKQVRKLSSSKTIAFGTLLFAITGYGVLAQGSTSNLDLDNIARVDLQPEEINRYSPSYRDYERRLSSKIDRSQNSIALLMLADTLRGSDRHGGNMIAILNDHKNRVSGAVSFKGGRHDFSIGGNLAGRVGSSELVQKVTGVGAEVRAKLDLNLIKRGRELIPTSGRIKEQTGMDYVLGGGGIATRECGSISGEVTAPLAQGLAKGSLGAGGQLCHAYEPSKMTYLGKWVAENQTRLRAIEDGRGDDFQFITEALFRHHVSTCGNLVLAEPQSCGEIETHLNALREGGFLGALPTDIRTEDQIREAFKNEPGNKLLNEFSVEFKREIEELENLIGRELGDMEQQMLALLAGDKKLTESLSEVQLEQVKQGAILEVLADPLVREHLYTQAIIQSQQQLQQRQEVMNNFLRDTSYDSFANGVRTDEEVQDLKDRKFKLDVRQINSEFELRREASLAIQNTLLLLGALSDSPEFQQRVNKAFLLINSASELIRAGQIVSKAISAGNLTSTATLGAISGGAGAALVIVSLLSSSSDSGPSELEVVMDFLEQRLDVVDLKLDQLTRIGLSNSEKLDTLLEAQRTITDVVVQNARNIQASRVDIAQLRQVVESLEHRFDELQSFAQSEFDKATFHRNLIFQEQLKINQDDHMSSIDTIFRKWFSVDAGVINKLNTGKYDDAFIDNVRDQRARLLALITQLGEEKFISSSELVQSDPDKYRLFPAQLLSLYPEFSDQVNSVVLDESYRILSDGLDLIPWRYEEDLKQKHRAIFAPVDTQDFTDLKNPDFLAYAVRNYLTFILALTPEAQQAVGFSDLSEIDAMIGRLSRSKVSAQTLLWQSLTLIQKMMVSWDVQLSSGFESASSLFLTHRRDFDGYIFSSEKLSAKDFKNLGDLEVFVKDLGRDREVVDWLIANSESYVVDELEGDFAEIIQLLESFSDGSFEINPRISEKIDLAEFLSYQRPISHIKALHDAFSQGKLFSKEDLSFLEAFKQKPLLEISPKDIEKLIGLIRSDRQLLRFALEEGLVDLALQRDNQVVDANGDEPGLAKPVAEIEDTTYHSDTVTHKYVETFLGWKYNNTYERYRYDCNGVKINSLDEDYIEQAHYGFPLDEGGLIRGRNINWLLDSRLYPLREEAMIYCIREGEKQNVVDIRPYLLGYYTGYDFYVALRDEERYSDEEFVRKHVMMGNGAKLFYRENSVCRLSVEWRPDNNGVDGVDIGRSIAIDSQYVIGKVDSPFLYASSREVDQVHKKLFAPDGTPLREGFERSCNAYDQSVSYSDHPGKMSAVQVGKPKPAREILSEWRSIDEDNLQVDQSFRKGLIGVFTKRLKEQSVQRVKDIGFYFRNPANYSRDILQLMKTQAPNEISSDDRELLKRVYESRGNNAFFSHPIFEKFNSVLRASDGAGTATQADEIAKKVETIKYERKLPEAIKLFAEWGLGECLYQTPEYFPILALFREPINGITLPQAMEILYDEKQFESYRLAHIVIKTARIRLENRLDQIRDFPPRPINSATRNHPHWDKYLGIDKGEALKIALQSNCEPGHSSILELEEYADLMKEFDLVH
ncbi:hypothetical protein GCM10008090_30680 [Arenicella chitinivorans]|uniref:Uncharacterized protein n=1 Tax=Arenicella chitinivorans TaxID=1329800 RepID=A0A918VSI4_9GAMM|nr:hypothetical protein [Arenicella chitinivorans]GHA18895.1 hypothetical protein GCM10008090_30680 [Arenicella chitinivorans]